MSTELSELRNLWDTTPEPVERTRADARASLLEEIDKERRSTLRQAPRARRQRMVSRQQLGALFATVAVCLLVVGVASAFGLGLLPFLDFGQAEKASPESRVVKNFAVLDQGAPPGMASDVIPNETRKVATFGNRTLWVAPTRQGGFCTDLAGEGGCDRLGTVPLSVSWSIEQSGTDPLSQKSFGGLPIVDRVAGYVNARWAESLEIRFEDGDVVKPHVVWVSKPIDAGFFVQAIPTAHRQAGHLISAVVGLDREGRLVTSKSLDRSPSDAPPQEAILDQSRQLAVIETGDGPAVLYSAPTRYEGRCTWFELGNEAITVLPCLPKGYEHQTGLALAVHSFGGRLILAGACGYSAIQFLHRNGSARQVPCTDGVVFTELNPSDAAGGVRALDPEGRPLLGSTVPVPGLIQPG